MSPLQSKNLLKPDSLSIAKKVINTEIDSLKKLLNHLDDSFDLAVQTIKDARAKKARVVLSGLGKSGIIAQKISASLSSTGVSSLFLHSAEATHGDLGMVQKDDVIVLFSHSGEGSETLQCIPYLKTHKNFIIAITGSPSSTLANLADCVLYSAITCEACDLDLVPTSSTTSMLALGDALVVALMKHNHFEASDFAQFHPSGNLGKRLLTSVSEVMQTDIPKVQKSAGMVEIINEMTHGRLGCVLVMDEDALVGIITDGDLRRVMELYPKDILSLKATDLATKNPISISPKMKLEDAKNLMNEKKITCLIVAENHKVQGIVQIYHCEI